MSGVPRRWGAFLLAMLFVAGVSLGLDRWTVDSYRPRLADLPGVGPEGVAALERAGLRGVGSVAEADSGRVAAVTGLSPVDAGVVVRTARLSRLRGLGVPAASVLVREGVGSICRVAESGTARVSEIFRAAPELGPRRGRKARVRVRVREARERCGQEGREGSAGPPPAPARPWSGTLRAARDAG